MRIFTRVLAISALAIGCAAALPSCDSEMANVHGTMVASGTGDTTYTAAQDGTITIYDKSWNKIVYVGDVKAGQIVRVNTGTEKILVDNMPRVEQANVGGGSQFQFYLRPAPAMTTIEHTTTTTDANGTIQRDTVTQIPK